MFCSFCGAVLQYFGSSHLARALLSVFNYCYDFRCDPKWQFMEFNCDCCLVPPGSTCLQQGARKAKRRERRAEPSNMVVVVLIAQGRFVVFRSLCVILSKYQFVNLNFRFVKLISIP